MLLPYLKILQTKKVILGSQSKTRNELFKAQNIPYEKFTSQFPQDLDKSMFATPEQYNLVSLMIGRKHAEENNTNKQWDILVCGDTILEFQGKIIEKPIDANDCVDMMGKLSNNKHTTFTAHIIKFNTQPQIEYEWVSKAEVTFGEITKQILAEFAKTDEPYIHSGGYQLTGMSGSFIKSINGSFTTVQGLDMYDVGRKMIQGMKLAKWI